VKMLSLNVPMGDRNPNANTGILLGAYAIAMVICVGLAFLLPGNFYTSKWLHGLPIVAAMGVLPMMRWAERSRIRNAIENEGGRILWMKRLPFWRQDNWTRKPGWSRGPKYEVEFVDLLGAAHRGLCRSSFIYGMTWLNLR
jgi:hypothetical protein